MLEAALDAGALGGKINGSGGGGCMFDYTLDRPEEVAVAVEMLDQVVEAIIDSARTEKIGDGKIFVTDLEQAHRIRTGETGNSAL